MRARRRASRRFTESETTCGSGWLIVGIGFFWREDQPPATAGGSDLMKLSGKSIVGFRRGASDGDAIRAINPATGEELCPTYYSASPEEVDEAARLASKAFETYARISGKDKAIFLRKIAENIEDLSDELVERATQETALPVPRIKTETARTTNQL